MAAELQAMQVSNFIIDDEEDSLGYQKQTQVSEQLANNPLSVITSSLNMQQQQQQQQSSTSQYQQQKRWPGKGSAVAGENLHPKQLQQQNIKGGGNSIQQQVSQYQLQGNNCFNSKASAGSGGGGGGTGGVANTLVLQTTGMITAQKMLPSSLNILLGSSLLPSNFQTQAACSYFMRNPNNNLDNNQGLTPQRFNFKSQQQMAAFGAASAAVASKHRLVQKQPNSALTHEELHLQVDEELFQFNYEWELFQATHMQSTQEEHLSHEEAAERLSSKFYQSRLLHQLEESSNKLTEGSLCNFQVDVSEQDNNRPFEFLRQFRVDNWCGRSMQEEYLDLVENIEEYTNKLYFAIQEKAEESLRKHNFTGVTAGGVTMHCSSPTVQQRISPNQLIRTAVQSVLEYSENRTIVPRYAREGDWLCHCSNLNFSYRGTCNKCNLMKPKYVHKLSADLNLKLDEMEKQLLTIDSKIVQAPEAATSAALNQQQTEVLVSSQRQIILSENIWICKCCRSINYSKTSICVCCSMSKYIDKGKLQDLTQNSQRKLAKFAEKLQARRGEQFQKKSNTQKKAHPSSHPVGEEVKQNKVVREKKKINIERVQELSIVRKQFKRSEHNSDSQSEEKTRDGLENETVRDQDEEEELNTNNSTAEEQLQLVEEVEDEEEEVFSHSSGTDQSDSDDEEEGEHEESTLNSSERFRNHQEEREIDFEIDLSSESPSA